MALPQQRSLSRRLTRRRRSTSRSSCLKTVLHVWAQEAEFRKCALPLATTVPLSPKDCRGFTLPPVAFQRCGGTAASRTTDGGLVSLVSVLTRGPARGAPVLTNSVLISTFWLASGLMSVSKV